MSGRGYIAETPKAVCEFCRKSAELRPYGPFGENICFECGMKDEETTEKRVNQHIFGDKFDA